MIDADSLLVVTGDRRWPGDHAWNKQPMSLPAQTSGQIEVSLKHNESYIDGAFTVTSVCIQVCGPYI